MATHSSTAKSYGRKFQIARKDGQNNKEGEPYFFEWVDNFPVDILKGQIFEARPGKSGIRHYELFKKIDGYLVDLSIEDKDFGEGKLEKCLVAHMVDGEEDYKFEFGQPDGRYSSDFMKRILDANFNPSARLSLSPFCITDGQKTNIGLSCYSGANKLLAGYAEPHLSGMAEPTRFFNPKLGRDEYDFKPQAYWLWAQVQARVIPILKHDPISAPMPRQMPNPDAVLSNNQATSAPMPGNDWNYSQPTDEGDDLPF